MICERFRQSTILKKNISGANRPILIKIDVNLNWVGGRLQKDFGRKYHYCVFHGNKYLL